MKRLILFALLCTVSSLVFAQRSKTNGLTLGVYLNTTEHKPEGMQMPPLKDFGIGAHIGIGLFNHLVIFADADVNIFDSAMEVDYLGQVDLGAKLMLLGKSSFVRPYIGGAYTYIARGSDDNVRTMLQTGNGVTAIGGAAIYLSKRIALDVSYRHSFLEYNELRVDDNVMPFPVYDVITSRIRFRITFNL